MTFALTEWLASQLPTHYSTIHEHPRANMIEELTFGNSIDDNEGIKVLQNFFQSHQTIWVNQHLNFKLLYLH
jgi:hypothetical protein